MHPSRRGLDAATSLGKWRRRGRVYPLFGPPRRARRRAPLYPPIRSPAAAQRGAAYRGAALPFRWFSRRRSPVHAAMRPPQEYVWAHGGPRKRARRLSKPSVGPAEALASVASASEVFDSGCRGRSLAALRGPRRPCRRERATAGLLSARQERRTSYPVIEQIRRCCARPRTPAPFQLPQSHGPLPANSVSAGMSPKRSSIPLGRPLRREARRREAARRAPHFASLASPWASPALATTRPVRPVRPVRADAGVTARRARPGTADSSYCGRNSRPHHCCPAHNALVAFALSRRSASKCLEHGVPAAGLAVHRPPCPSVAWRPVLTRP